MSIIATLVKRSYYSRPQYYFVTYQNIVIYSYNVIYRPDDRPDVDYCIYAHACCPLVNGI